MIAGRPEEEALEVLTSLCNSINGQQLVELNLSDNALGEKGVRACAGVVGNQSVLERLYFCNNGISETAAGVIADMLLFRTPTVLTTFHFYNNMSGSGGGVALVSYCTIV